MDAITTLYVGDTFSTPPNSPPPRSSTSSDPDGQKDKVSLTSYEKAVNLNPTSSWKDGGKINHTMPQHVSSPVKHQPPLSSPPANLLPGYPNVEIINSSPAAVRVGFFDATVEATKAGELPGSSNVRESVITTPPHSSVKKAVTSLTGSFGSSQDSGSRIVKPARDVRSSSPRSIEDVDREREKMYVPLGKSVPKRKGSGTLSQFSILSVSLCTRAAVCCSHF